MILFFVFSSQLVTRGRAVGTLPEEERTVVDLLWFEGLTQAEAAIALGVSERTIRRKWYSARYLLFKALRHE